MVVVTMPTSPARRMRLAKRPRKPGDPRPPRPDMESILDLDASPPTSERYDPERPLAAPPPSSCPHGVDVTTCRACIEPKIRRVEIDQRTGLLRIGGVLQERGFIPAGQSSRYGEKLAARRQRAKADDDDDSEEE